MSTGHPGSGSTPPRWQQAPLPEDSATRVVPDAHGTSLPPQAPSAASVRPRFADTAAAFQSMTPLQPGALLNNTYRIDRMLGRGGMGEVYRGTNVHTGDLVAIKVIRPELVDDPQMRDLFLREATALRKIRHPAIVSYEGASADASGRLYLVMDFVEGPSLAQVVTNRPLSPPQVQALRRRIAEGLQAAHEQNVVHRDLSPDNIILRGGDLNHATIIDFGIARRTDISKTSVIGQSFAGKIEYAAPEQFGMFSGVADARSDIYTLGLVLVAASLGRPIDMGISAMAAIQARQKVPDLSQVPAALRPGLARMLAPDPNARPQSMRDVAALDALDAAGGGRQRSGLRVALLAGGLVMVAAVAGAFAVSDPVSMVRSWFDTGAAARQAQAWRQAVEVDTVAAYEAFLAQHPNAPQAAEARQRLAAARQAQVQAQAWRQAVQADTAAAYEAFLAQYPNASQAAEARQRLTAVQQREVRGRDEEASWRRAQNATTPEPLLDYLQRYPDGRYAEAARRKLAGMQGPSISSPPTRITWTPAPCSAVPLWAPPAFTCQVSNEYTLPGSDRRFRGFAAGGVVGDWHTQMWMHEVLGQEGIAITTPIEQLLMQLNAITQAGTDWSTVLTYGGAEFMTFRSGAANCVALRKPGERRNPGYGSVFTAVQCAPPGQPLYPNDIRTTIDGVRLK
ncbi:MAG TPA: protein kinase [Vineibacter sp.]|nr:protein kinase [Vineibacter sp.]